MIILPNMVHGSESALSPAIMAVLPKDPYEQLDVARRITSLAVSSRVDLLEAEIDKLRQKVADRDMTISTLQGRVNELEHETQKAFMQLSSAVEEQERLAAEKISLEESVKKLKRDVAKLETFKKALMSSLQDEDESPAPMSVEDKQPARQMPLVAPEPERKFTPNLVAISQQDPKTKSPNQSAVPMTPSNLTPGPLTPEPKFTPNLVAISQQDPKTKSPNQSAVPMTPSNLTPGPLTPGLSPSRSPRTHSASNSPTKSRSMSISPTKKKLLKGSSAATSPIKSRPRSTISFSGESTKASNKWHSVNDGAVSLPSSLASSKHTTAPNSPPHKGFYYFPFACNAVLGNTPNLSMATIFIIS
ncbi:hypothetical protein KP509_30G014900 [Ceratopteris richardii]|uniref:Uncharacterized protein n=1 Tax=Ceratopteris richardii TaxID=49495 RepID=A0A8T2R0V6_CERRI|nr:hypothetical protein KP509_30G014900 [Ceratopteris richardii]